MSTLIVKVKKLHPKAQMPTRATEGAACWDVYALQDTTIWRTNPCNKIPTGLAFEVPPSYFIDIRPRSGLASEGLTILNSPGTLDSDYRGELLILAWATFKDSIDIKKGDRIAQIRLEKVTQIEWREVKELSKTRRGTKGFGSTGK